MITSERGDAAGRILPRHQDRLAVVYVRQSSVTQIERNPESTRVQYGLRDAAVRLGWPIGRVMSGASAEGRAGFQRLLAEVALDHVGIVLGAEMSRLARSNKDFHQLLELCARFGTLIGDLDGLYDPTRYNDRLLLGLKGAMSEAELHILRQRLWQGKLQKATRGELGRPVPTGYLRRPSGEVVLDPDEQVRAVVDRVFDVFDRLGSAHGVLRHLVAEGVKIGVRLRTGPDIGDLVWRRPQIGLITDMLKNPIYCGSYVYGRRQTDSRRKKPGQQGSGRTALVPKKDWLAEVPDCFPAYITREQYDANVARLAANRSKYASPGAPRDGSALLQGLVVCAQCNQHMSVQYTKSRSGHGHTRYVCSANYSRYGGTRCQSLPVTELDRQVSEIALDALAPAGIEISLRVGEAVETERSHADSMWDKRVERARYEASRAERSYRSVDPENRLVARTLEKAWEEKLVAVQQLQEDYERHRQAEPRILSDADRNRIRAVSADIPALWSATATTNADRKAILRLLVDTVRVDATANNENVLATVVWAGGQETRLDFVRGVGRLDMLRDHRRLLDRIRELRVEGFSGDQSADRLNAEGWRTPRARGLFNGQLVRSMIERYGMLEVPRGPRRFDGLEEHEWPIRDLVHELDVPRVTLYGWVRRGVVRARRLPSRNEWVVFMDPNERERLLDYRGRHRTPEEAEPRGVHRG